MLFHVFGGRNVVEWIKNGDWGSLQMRDLQGDVYRVMHDQPARRLAVSMSSYPRDQGRALHWLWDGAGLFVGQFFPVLLIELDGVGCQREEAVYLTPRFRLEDPRDG